MVVMCTPHQTSNQGLRLLTLESNPQGILHTENSLVIAVFEQCIPLFEIVLATFFSVQWRPSNHSHDLLIQWFPGFCS